MAKKIFIKEERRARKEHTCTSCGTTIKTGVTYLYVKGIEGKNGFYLKYFCPECYDKNNL